MPSVSLRAAPSTKYAGGVCWHLRWREGGKSRSLSLRTGSRQKAERARDEKRRELEAGQVVTAATAAKTKPLDVLERYLTSLTVRGLRPATRAHYDEKLRPLCRRYRTTPLPLWTRSMLEAHIGAHPGWSDRTRQMVVVACRTFVRWCWASRFIEPGEDFTGGLRIRTRPPEDHSTLTRKEVSALLDDVRSRKRVAYLEMPVALGAYAGLAEGDWRALEWSAVDLDAGRITGRRSKTGRRYVVGICAPLDAILRRHRAVSGPVCRGLPGNARSAYHALRRAQARVGIEDAPKGQNGWHRLRHTFLTWLADAGVPDHERRLAGGHAPGSPMAARYTHPDDARTISATRAAIE